MVVQKYVLGILTSVVLVMFVSADEFPGIEGLMTQEEYEAAGLNKLSTAEITHLNNWLIRYTARDAKYIGQTVDVVKEQKNEAVIVSKIDGKFVGWRGKTLFKLTNGQVWQQRNSGILKTNLDDPDVIITRNIMGFYKLKIKKTGKVVGVKRVK